jgi:pimeloyl-ACP methyl ester carboxylesterase
MPFVNNNGIKIHYEVKGQGLPLVLQHGLTGNLKNWRDYGYTVAMSKEYQLILIDARGHGQSDKPHDPASYRPPSFAGDIIKVLDDLGIKKAGYMGYSMGGSIGFHGIARYTLSRFNYLILGGMSPYYTEIEAEAMQPRLASLQMAAEQGMEAHVAYLEKRDGLKLKPDYRAAVLANDPFALLAVTQSLSTWHGAEDILRLIPVPCLVYAGEADIFHPGAKKGAAAMPDARFFSLPGLNHVQAYQSSALVLPHVKKFLTEANS